MAEAAQIDGSTTLPSSFSAGKRDTKEGDNDSPHNMGLIVEGAVLHLERGVWSIVQ